MPGLFLVGVFVAFSEYRILTLIGFLLLVYLAFGYESVLILNNYKKTFECRRGYRGLTNVERGSFEQLKWVELGYSYTSGRYSTTRSYAANLHFDRPFSKPFELFTSQSIETFFENVRKLRAHVSLPVFKSEELDKETNSLKNLDDLLREEFPTKQ